MSKRVAKRRPSWLLVENYAMPTELCPRCPGCDKPKTVINQAPESDGHGLSRWPRLCCSACGQWWELTRHTAAWYLGWIDAVDRMRLLETLRERDHQIKSNR